MIIISWLIMGLAAGLLASRMSHHRGPALALDLALGLAGALAGGLAMSSLGFPHPAPFIVAGFLGAAIGSFSMLAAYRAIFQRA